MIKISETDAVQLGLQPSIQASQDLGFTDFKKSSAITLKNAYLDLENLGVLRKANPRLVIRKPIDFIKTASTEAQVWQSWRQVVEQEHYLAKYQISTALVGQLSDVHLPSSFYNYKDNNFFKPFKETKVAKRLKDFNDFSYSRFRFPEKSSNTVYLEVETLDGAQTLRPKFVGIISKEENRKAYYRWYPNATRFASGQQQSPYDDLNLSGFNIPYPNTVSIYEGTAFNIPTKISTKFNSNNSQSLNGLLVISTGDAEQKTICYVSPHGLETGFLNTIEDIYTENNTRANAVQAGSAILATVVNASWYGSGQTGYLGRCDGSGYIDTINGTYRQAPVSLVLGGSKSARKTFHQIGNSQRQIYFDSTMPTQYGSGRWCISTSGASGVIYMHQPNSLLDWKKTDPRSLSGPWAAASGHPLAASGLFLTRAGVRKPVVSNLKYCRQSKVVNTERLQVPSLIIDSKYTNSGYVLPEGIKIVNRTYTVPVYSSWKYNITGVMGPEHSGYIIDGVPLKMTQILASGISIPQQTYQSVKYSIDADQHFKQDIPLKNTYFYKFYNQLYSRNNKTIATGTWDGIVPSGVKVSVELLSLTLNTEIGILNDQNLAVVYAGYGNEDSIDTALQTGISRNGAYRLFPNPSLQYVVSGEVPWEQNRYPYQHSFNEFGQLTYTAFKSGPTEVDALNITKSTAIKKINSKILQLVNKALPTATYKNQKWRRLKMFKAKLEGGYFNNKFSRLVVPESAVPGSQIQTRVSRRLNQTTPVNPV
jgi:hypothetical protein